jgi:hypothetical protein
MGSPGVQLSNHKAGYGVGTATPYPMSLTGDSRTSRRVKGVDVLFNSMSRRWTFTLLIGSWAPVVIMVCLGCTSMTSGDGTTNQGSMDQAMAGSLLDARMMDGAFANDLGVAIDGAKIDSAVMDIRVNDEDAMVDVGVGRPDDAAPRPMADADLCPARATRSEPTLVDRFEDGSPELEVAANGYRVIAPEGHQALAEYTLGALPNCHAAIAEHMGYCHPWSEAIVHYGRFELHRAKAEDGVVYIGQPEASLTRLDQPDVWQTLPVLCGGQSTLAHESVHTFQPADLPAWLKEGWADYFGRIVVGGSTYECGETSVCIRPPNTGGRPQPDECPNPVEYWDLSDPDWGTRPDPDDDRGEGGQSNKGRYYKTGTCFWQSIRDAYGPDILRTIFRLMHLNQRDDLPVFPFSAQTNDLLIRTYFVPVTGPEVWALVAPYGVVPTQ